MSVKALSLVNIEIGCLLQIFKSRSLSGFHMYYVRLRSDIMSHKLVRIALIRTYTHMLFFQVLS